MRDLLDRLLKGHPHAVALCMAVFDWATFYDHVADGDVTGAEAQRALHEAMWLMAVVIPANPFYRMFHVELTVSLANGIASWRAANELAKGDAQDLMLAHVLRWKLIEFFLHVARLAHGREWADAQAPEFWRAMTRDHSFAEFVAEHQETAC